MAAGGMAGASLLAACNSKGPQAARSLLDLAAAKNETVERALEIHGAPIYVRHEIVHNKYVVEDLRAKGAVFVEELDEVPAGGTVIFSAHGVSQQVRADADRRGRGLNGMCNTSGMCWRRFCRSRG